jgi:hypothetical protein
MVYKQAWSIKNYRYVWDVSPIHLTSVLGVLGTQETFCIVIAGLLERDSGLLLPEFDK